MKKTISGAGDLKAERPHGRYRHGAPGHAAASATSSRVAGTTWRGRRRTPLHRNLVTGGDDPLLPHIVAHLATADRADIVVSLALESGVHRVFESNTPAICWPEEDASAS